MRARALPAVCWSTRQVLLERINARTDELLEVSASSIEDALRRCAEERGERRSSERVASQRPQG